MVKSPGRSVSTTSQTAVTGQSTFKYETVAVTSFINSVERPQNILVLFASVALIEPGFTEKMIALPIFFDHAYIDSTSI